MLIVAAMKASKILGFIILGSVNKRNYEHDTEEYVNTSFLNWLSFLLLGG